MKNYWQEIFILFPTNISEMLWSPFQPDPVLRQHRDLFHDPQRNPRSFALHFQLNQNLAESSKRQFAR